MKRIRPIGLALVAMFAFSAFAASAAVAVEGPFWKVNGARLAAGASRLLLAAAKENFTLEATALGQKLTCTGLSLPVGNQMQINGSTGANAGTSKEIIHFTGCTQTGNGEPCSLVNGLIITQPVTNTLGYSTAARGGPIKVLFAPETGKVFTTVNYTGAGCLTTTQNISGTVVALAQVGGAQLQPGNTIESLHGEVKFHKLAQSIFVEKAGVVGAEIKGKLELAGIAASLVGTALITVDEAGGAVKWGVTA